MDTSGIKTTATYLSTGALAAKALVIIAAWLRLPLNLDDAMIFVALGGTAWHTAVVYLQAWLATKPQTPQVKAAESVLTVPAPIGEPVPVH